MPPPTTSTTSGAIPQEILILDAVVRALRELPESRTIKIRLRLEYYDPTRRAYRYLPGGAWSSTLMRTSPAILTKVILASLQNAVAMLRRDVGA